MDIFRDRVEILEVLSRHQIYIDLQDGEGYAALYAEDGRYDSPFGRARGTAEISEMFEGLRVRLHHWQAAFQWTGYGRYRW